MSVTRRKRKKADGTEVEFYWIDFWANGPDGEPVRVRRTAKSKKQNLAKQEEANLLKQVLDGTYVPPRSEKRKKLEEERKRIPTFKECVEDHFIPWLEKHAKKSGNRSRKSILTNHLIPFFGDLLLSEIATRDVKKFALQIDKYAPTTRKGILNLLNKVLNEAKEDGFIKGTPSIKRILQSTPKPDRSQPKHLTIEEAEKFLAVAKQDRPDMYPTFLCSLRTGLRKGEVIGLKWKSVDLDKKTILVENNKNRDGEGTPKSSRKRKVYITPDLEAVLKALPSRFTEGYVFTKKDGSPWAEYDFYRPMGALLKKAGVKHVNFHGLRHSFACHMVNYGTSMYALRDLMGHHSITQTEIYAKPGEEHAKAAMEAFAAKLAHE